MQEGMRKHKPPDEGRFAPQGERAQTEIPGLGVDVSCPTFILRPAQRFSHSPPEQHGQAATHRRARGKGPGGEGASGVSYGPLCSPWGLALARPPPGLCRAGSGVCRRDLRPDLSQEFEGGIFLFSGHG
jgi:hypothetical protein